MVITETFVRDVIRHSRVSLGLPPSQDETIDVAHVAASLRRAADILCPCSPSTLEGAVMESFLHLTNEIEPLAQVTSSAVESLILYGDLLELDHVTIDNPLVKSNWVFPAPPSFVRRPSGGVFIIGIAPDASTPLPQSLSDRIEYQGFTRILMPLPTEDLPVVLRGLGLLELPAATWLKSPRPTAPADLLSSMVQKLTSQERSGHIPDLSILDTTRNVGFYSGRWVTPTTETGNFVARRPQAYGAPLWVFAQLIDGKIIKLLDLPLKGNRWRGCDVAWQLQMAIDYLRGTPQLYRRRPAPTGAILDFFSPLPLWMQRRLSIVGRQEPREGCLFSYWVPEREVAIEEAFLQSDAWLKRREVLEEGNGDGTNNQGND